MPFSVLWFTQKTELRPAANLTERSLKDKGKGKNKRMKGNKKEKDEFLEEQEIMKIRESIYD